MALRVDCEVKSVPDMWGDDGPIQDMTWSPDGQRLVTASKGGVLRLWDSKLQRTRFTEQFGGDPINCVRWSGDGSTLVCGTDSGAVFRVNPRTIEFGEWIRRPNGYPVRCLAWAPSSLDLAFAGDDMKVYLADCRPGRGSVSIRPGSGHTSPIASLAWSPDAKTLVSGTRHGSIGVWVTGSVDWQLRHFLPGPAENPLFPHDDEIGSMSWARSADALVSASRDGVIRSWMVDSRREVANRKFLPNPLFAVDSCLEGRLLVAQSLEKLHFFHADGLEEIGDIDWPARPAGGGLAVSAVSSSIATVDGVDDGVRILKVDFEAILKSARVTARRYKNAKVIVLGARGAGKTSLIHGLVGQSFQDDHVSHDLRVHRLTLPDVDLDDASRERREIALWDLPSQSHFDLVQYLQATNDQGTDMALIVCDALAPSGARHLLHHLDAWQRRSSHGRHAKNLLRLLVASRCDRVPNCSDAQMRSALGEEWSDYELHLTSASEGHGIEALREAIASGIDWRNIEALHVFDAFDDIQTFVAARADAKLYLASVPSLYSLFIKRYPHYQQLVSLREFRCAIYMLENLDVVYYLKFGDQVLLRPNYFYTYANALMAAARRDEKEMGRLPLEEAELGRSERIEIADAARIPDSQQESLLLKATIEELRETQLVSIVPTDGKNYLVFPMLPTHSVSQKLTDLQVAAACTLIGEDDEIYSSLVVRLLGLPHFFPEFELGSDGVVFATSDGTRCGVLRDPNTEPDHSRLNVMLDKSASEQTRKMLLDYVQTHIADRLAARAVKWVINDDWASELSSKTVQRVRVFFSYDREDFTNARMIADTIRQHGIDSWLEDLEVLPGDRRSKRNDSREQHDVAVVAVSKGRLSKTMTADVHAFRKRGARIVPIILPGVAKSFNAPGILADYEMVDFRNLGSEPYQRLVQGVLAPGRVLDSPPSKTGHVFLSYCRDNADLVESIHDYLESEGHAVWWDQDIPCGSDWKAEIRRAMQNAYAVVVCFSQEIDRRERTGVYPEILDAIEIYRTFPPSSIYLLPVRLSECQIPEVEIDATRTLRSIQHIDLFGPERSETLANLVRALENARRRG